MFSVYNLFAKIFSLGQPETFHWIVLTELFGGGAGVGEGLDKFTKQEEVVSHSPKRPSGWGPDNQAIMSCLLSFSLWLSEYLCVFYKAKVFQEERLMEPTFPGPDKIHDNTAQ